MKYNLLLRLLQWYIFLYRYIRKYNSNIQFFIQLIHKYHHSQCSVGFVFYQKCTNYLVQLSWFIEAPSKTRLTDLLMALIYVQTGVRCYTSGKHCEPCKNRERFTHTCSFPHTLISQRVSLLFDLSSFKINLRINNYRSSKLAQRVYRKETFLHY